MEIRVPASLRAKASAAVSDALTRDFPGADIRITSFRSKLIAERSALAKDLSAIASAVRFHGTGSESTHAAGSQFPVGGGETFSFEGTWTRAKGLVSLALKKLGNIYGEAAAK